MAANVPSIRSQLIGAWELTEYSLYLENDPSNKIYPMTPEVKGIIMYTPDGYMSAQLHTPGQNPFDGEQLFDRTDSPTKAQSDWAQVGLNYIAYTGEFYLDERGDELGCPILMHHMRCASLPSFVGDLQRRILRFEDKAGERYLVLAPANKVNVRGEDRVVVACWRKLPVNERTGGQIKQ
jgi:hypothetical protein